MYQCHTVGCGLWNHEACLVKDLEEKAWAKFQAGTLTYEREEKEANISFAQKVGQASHQLGQFVKRGFATEGVKEDASTEPPSPPRATKKQKTTGGRKPWKGKLEAKLTRVTKSNREVAHQATVTQSVPDAACKPTPGFKPLVWNMQLSCLNCGQSLN